MDNAEREKILASARIIRGSHENAFPCEPQRQSTRDEFAAARDALRAEEFEVAPTHVASIPRPLALSPVAARVAHGGHRRRGGGGDGSGFPGGVRSWSREVDVVRLVRGVAVAVDFDHLATMDQKCAGELEGIALDPARKMSGQCGLEQAPEHSGTKKLP